MKGKIALVGNPNSGKTTLFNELTGSRQSVGNWPGVTVEKKEGKLKLPGTNVVVVDLPGIYSLSPYSLEEIIARDFIISEKPDALINIVDASNLERNLYLTFQLAELGAPMVVALNMMDIVRKRGDVIDTAKLMKALGCPVVEISAFKSEGITELARVALTMSERDVPQFAYFPDDIEKVISQVQKIAQSLSGGDEYPARWLAVKLMERDEKLTEKLALSDENKEKIDCITAAVEAAYDDDIESIITSARYDSVEKMLSGRYKKQERGSLSVSERIDKVLTNRVLALPLFFLIMWGVYFIAIQTAGEYTIGWVEQLVGWASASIQSQLEIWGAVPWLVSLVVDGIIGGIGSVLVFLPQLMILFLLISLLEDVGYMARVAFIMDRIFRRIGLSGKSFIPMLIGTGCSVPGVMASRTIENDKDRKMTIMLTPFIPCGAKLPVFALFAALVFRGASWVGPSMYLIGIAAVILSGFMLKRTRLFKGDPAPFILELPSYKLPRVKSLVLHMWEKCKSFVIKAGTVIFVAVTVIWVLQSFSFSFEYLGPDNIEQSMLAGAGKVVAPIFAPMGFGNWPSAVAVISGMVAKEIIVSTMAVITSAVTVSFTSVSAYAFMVFTLLAAPCFAAIGATRREMGGWKWTLIAVGYQTGFAYVLAAIVNIIGSVLFPVREIVLSGNIEAAGETLESNALLGNPLIYIFAGILVAAAIISIAGMLRHKRRAEDTAKLGTGEAKL